MRRINALQSVLFLLLASVFLASPAFSDEKIELTASQVNMLDNLQGQGYIKINPQLNKVFISSQLWSSMKYELKEDFAATLAIHCGNAKGNRLYWVEIFDEYSGKKLARYSRSRGFSVY